VLRVSGPGGAVLLPGDVEGVGERALIEREGKALGADVLVVPHHGSRGSSSQAFVAAVRPRHALFATGYRNRFGFPAPEVLERYQVAGAAVHDTARAGAIRVVLAPGRAPVVTHHRTETRRFWHATPGE
jgi:competence protein ComEC